MNMNLYISLFKSALPKDHDFGNSRVYMVKRFELLLDYLRFFEIHLEKDNFSENLKKMKYNPNANNIIVFYVSESPHHGEVFLVSDSLNYYGREFIVKRYNYVFAKKIVEENFVEIINR